MSVVCSSADCVSGSVSASFTFEVFFVHTCSMFVCEPYAKHCVFLPSFAGGTAGDGSEPDQGTNRQGALFVLFRVCKVHILHAAHDLLHLRSVLYISNKLRFPFLQGKTEASERQGFGFYAKVMFIYFVCVVL